jgi:DNA replication initiation complex subunit (GINS family)
MIEKLKNTYAILNNIEDQNSKKFVSSAFKDLNKTLDLDLKEYISVNNSNFSNEEKELISDIIYKIEVLETKILPKANLINSFSDSII